MPHHCRSHRLLSVLSLAGLVIGLFGTPFKSESVSAMAATYYASTVQAGVTCSMFYPCSLQMAVEKAADGDTIIVEAGTYHSTGEHVLHINKDVVLRGGWNGGVGRGMKIDPIAYPTVLDGEETRRVVLIDDDASPRLYGLEIMNGNIKDGEGGGVAIMNLTGGNVLIDQCWIHDNFAGWYGGGISIYKGSVTIRNSTLAHNGTTNGGGAIIAGIGTAVVLEGNIIGSNIAAYGSAGHFDRASLTARSNFTHNNNGNPAFSISSQPGQSVIFENNIIRWTNGAAVSVSGAGPMSITFLHNTLGNNQGIGLALPNNTTGTIANNIFQGHQLDSISLGTGSTAEVSHNLFWQNGSDPNQGTQAIEADALLDSYSRLTYGSPAINAGSATGITVDIDLQKRPLGLPDIGADEYMVPLFIPLILR